MSDIDVRVQDVVKCFGSVAAVNGVSFEVPKGSFFSILGPSGSGKTTLMRMIAGFTEPTSGDIFIGEELANRLPPNKRRTNMVFQNLAMFPMMNVFDNVAFGLRRRRVPNREVASRVNAILERVGLAGLGSRRTEQLSGGQKQRVALARCLVLEPTVLILDEPLGALDLKLRESMKLELKRLHERSGTTFLYVTHDQGEALVMSDRIAVMNRGKFEQTGSPTEIYRSPHTHFVAGFVGESNRIPGKVFSTTDGQCELDVGGVSIRARNGENLTVGNEADVFIRPEAVAIQAGDATGGFRGIVRESIFDGASSRFIVKINMGAIEQDMKVAVTEGSTQATLSVGERVTLGWGDSAPIAFPRRSSDG